MHAPRYPWWLAIADLAPSICQKSCYSPDLAEKRLQILITYILQLNLCTVYEHNPLHKGLIAQFLTEFILVTAIYNKLLRQEFRVFVWHISRLY